MARISPGVEQYVGLRFLEGDSITSIAEYFACSRQAVEAILRGSLKHLIESKRTPGHVSADDLKEIFLAMPPEMRAEMLTPQPQPAQTDAEITK